MSTALIRWGWMAAAGAGVLWLVHVLLVVRADLSSGGPPFAVHVPLPGRVDGMLLMGVYLLLGLALQALHAAQQGRQRSLAIPGALLGVIPLTTGALGLCMLSLVPDVARQLAPVLEPVTRFGTLASALLLGGATLRARSLPRSTGVALLLFPLLTLPLDLARPLVEAVLPEYPLAETHVVVAGLLWIAIGSGMRRASRRAHGLPALAPAPASTALVPAGLPPRGRPLTPEQGLRLYAALRERELRLRRLRDPAPPRLPPRA